MKRLTFLLFLVLCAVIGLQAQNLTLPYIQDFSALSAGNMLSETGSPTAMVSGTLPGITSAHRAYQAGGAIRLGDVAEMGSFTTDPINAVGVRFVEVQFDAAAWIDTFTSQINLNLWQSESYYRLARYRTWLAYHSRRYAEVRYFFHCSDGTYAVSRIYYCR